MDPMITTSHGRIAITESDGKGLTVLLIHGNSSCKEVFKDQLQSELGHQYRLIALDLPGHGNSEDAERPESTYTMTGYADAALQVMAAVHQGPFAVVGWSLGGHIGLEMLAHTNSIVGLAISGTPPIGPDPEEMGHGFLPNPHMAFTGQELFSDDEAKIYARVTCGDRRYERFLEQAVLRTDGRARRVMMEAALSGQGVNQKHMAESTQVSLAIINGVEEALVNNEYVGSLAYSALWQDKIHLIEGAGHAPFWDQPARFNQLLAEFLLSVESTLD